MDSNQWNNRTRRSSLCFSYWGSKALLCELSSRSLYGPGQKEKLLETPGMFCLGALGKSHVVRGLLVLADYCLCSVFVRLEKKTPAFRQIHSYQYRRKNWLQISGSISHGGLLKISPLFCAVFNLLAQFFHIEKCPACIRFSEVSIIVWSLIKLN